MSTEFFNTMTGIEKIAKEVKFLDGSHPAVADKYEKRVEVIKQELEAIDADLKKELADFFKAQKRSKKSISKPKAI